MFRMAQPAQSSFGLAMGLRRQPRQANAATLGFGGPAAASPDAMAPTRMAPLSAPDTTPMPVATPTLGFPQHDDDSGDPRNIAHREALARSLMGDTGDKLSPNTQLVADGLKGTSAGQAPPLVDFRPGDAIRSALGMPDGLAPALGLSGSSGALADFRPGDAIRGALGMPNGLAPAIGDALGISRPQDLSTVVLPADNEDINPLSWI